MNREDCVLLFHSARKLNDKWFKNWIGRDFFKWQNCQRMQSRTDPKNGYDIGV
jgi:hypothetical protein